MSPSEDDLNKLKRLVDDVLEDKRMLETAERYVQQCEQITTDLHTQRARLDGIFSNQKRQSHVPELSAGDCKRKLSQSQAASVQQHGSAAFLTPQAAAVPSATTVTNRTPKAGRPIHDDVPNVVWWRDGYYAICCPFCRANATHPKGKKDDEKGFAGIVGLHGQCVQHYEKGSDIPHPKITQDELFEICGKQLIPPPIAAEMMDGGQTNFVKKAPAPPAHSSGGRYSSAHSDDSYVQSEDRGTRDSVASTTTWSNATSLMQRVETPAPGPSNAATSVNQRTGCPSQYDTQPSIKRERSSNAAEGRNDPSKRQHTDTAEFDEAEDEFLPAEEIDAMMMMMYSGKGKAPASRENGWA